MALPGKDIALDDAGDWLVQNGRVVFRADVRDKLRRRLMLVRGEWFLDTEAGFPHRELTLRKRPHVPHVQAAFAQHTRETPGIASLERIELDYDGATRKLSARIEARAEDGSIVEASV